MVGASLPPLGDETGVGTVAGGVAGLGGEGSPAATPWLYKTKLISGRRGSEQLFGTVSEARFQELTQPIADSPEVARLPAADWQAMQALSPQDLFNQATEVCGQLQHERCFVMFSLFKERHPQFVEGESVGRTSPHRLSALPIPSLISPPPPPPHTHPQRLHQRWRGARANGAAA